MNKAEIRQTLDAHKGTFRVLPTRAMNALQGILDTLNAEASAWPKVEEKPVVLGNRTSKTAKKSKRPRG